MGYKQVLWVIGSIVINKLELGGCCVFEGYSENRIHVGLGILARTDDAQTGFHLKILRYEGGVQKSNLEYCKLIEHLRKKRKNVGKMG